MNKIDTVYASGVPLYPPRVTPPSKPLNLPQSFIKFLSNPLLAIPESVYYEPLVLLRGPPAIAWVTAPALIKTVLLDRCDDFPQDPLLRRVLGRLFGNSILTSEGRDWHWQHQTVAPLFRHGEVLRYVPAMVAGAESAIKAWSAAPPGSTHAIDTDMVRALGGSKESLAALRSVRFSEPLRHGCSIRYRAAKTSGFARRDNLESEHERDPRRESLRD